MKEAHYHYAIHPFGVSYENRTHDSGITIRGFATKLTTPYRNTLKSAARKALYPQWSMTRPNVFLYGNHFGTLTPVFLNLLQLTQYTLQRRPWYLSRLLFTLWLLLSTWFCYHIETHYLVLTYSVGLSPATVIMCFNIIHHRKTHSVLIRHLQESNLLPQILGLYQRTNALGLNVFIYSYHIETHCLSSLCTLLHDRLHFV